MTQIAECATPTPSRGRQIKFTPERIQQIKNLVERGKSREEIAELIGVTVGSLQVTCSRLGISLRRPNFHNGIVSLRRNEARLNEVSTPRSGDGNDRALLHLIKEQLEQNSRPERAAAAEPCASWREVGRTATDAGVASFAIRMQYRGEARTTELPLTQDMIGQLAFEAAFRNVSMGELIAEIIAGVLTANRLHAVLGCKEPDQGNAGVVTESLPVQPSS